jgi:hypothetical protein
VDIQQDIFFPLMQTPRPRVTQGPTFPSKL